MGHPGATRKLDTNRPDEHRRRPVECGACHGTSLSERHAFAKQVADIEKVAVLRRNVAMHDMTCNDCGAAVDAPRAGTVRGTWLFPKMIAALWNIWCDTHCSFGMLALVCRRLWASSDQGHRGGGHRRGQRQARPAGRHAAPGHGRRARLRRDGRVRAQDDVWDDGRGRGGCGDDGTSPDPSRPRRRVRRGYIHCARDGSGNASVWAAPSRGVGILEGCFQDMVGAGTAADGLPNHDRCAVRQRDYAHELRETGKAAMTGDPAAAALHELLSALLRGVRASARPAARAARSRTAMRERRDAFKARILGIAAGYDPRFERLANRIREAADGLVACAACPALPATTHRSEQRMRTFVKDRYASPMLVSGRGRMRYSDGKTCRETWMDKAVNPVHEMQSILGVEPPREWA